MISIEDQIKCVKRELTMRGTVYTHQIARGKMRHDEAKREIETMRAVLHTLMDVQAGRKFREEG
jgi:hypothetical protein